MPTAAAKPRQATTRTSRTTTRTKTQSGSTDALASQLATKLHVSDMPKDTKGKRRVTNKPSPLSAEQRRTDAMLAVNAASKSLSSFVQSRWKAGSGTKSSKSSRQDASAADLARAARDGLRQLRELTRGDVDIERAASSVVGKLVTLEMYDAADELAADMRPALVTLCCADTLNMEEKDLRASLPFPPPDAPLNNTILNLVATFLLHSLTILTQTASNLTAFAVSLFDTPTLISWASHLQQLSSKQHDTLFTRAYTVLVTCASGPSLTPMTALRLRRYALLCLVHTRPTVIIPDTFWNQAYKFTASLLSKETAEQGAELAREVLAAFDELNHASASRQDAAEFASGIGYVGFCEFCMSVAKQLRDLGALNRIAEAMRGASPSPASSSSGAPGNTPEQLIRQATTIYAGLTQTALLLDQWTETPDDPTTRVQEAVAAIAKCRMYFDTYDNAEQKRVADKVTRAFEKLRRVSVKVVDSDLDKTSRVSNGAREASRLILQNAAQILEDVVRESNILSADTLTPALDSLFVLSRQTLVIARPDTYFSAYDYLARASSLVMNLSLAQEDPETIASRANYVRCVSGAFHNLAGTLYQAGRFDHAVRFMEQGCELGRKALSMYRSASGAEDADGVWKQLEEQLHRRWEILGVCQSKTGDRKLAYEAFLECVKTYPFAQPAFVQAIRRSFASSAFRASTPLKQISVLIDRVTYMGACELFRDHFELSAESWFKGKTGLANSDMQAWKCVAGAILERQMEGLSSSRWKPAIRALVQTLLKDSLDVYLSSERPIRRTRMLLNSLELAYFDGSDSHDPPTQIAEEIQSLLGQEDLGYDAELAPFRAQYLAAAHLWLALHMHRSGVSEQAQTVAHAKEACRTLRSMLASAPRQSLKKSPSPKVAKPTKRAQTAATRTVVKRKTAPRGKGSKAVHEEAAVTPKPRAALEAVSLNVPTTPPKSDTASQSHPLVFDDFPKLFELLQMTAQMIGLLGDILAKVSLLHVTRRLSERHAGATSNEYITASMNLAQEYVRLGRAEKAAHIFGQTLVTIKESDALPELRVLSLLRYAEALANAGNVHKSAEVYCEALAACRYIPDEEKGMPTAQRVKLRAETLERAAVASMAYSAMEYAKGDLTNSLNGLLQSLRLWNRATDTLARLNPPVAIAKPHADDNPFDVSEPKSLKSASDDSSKSVEQTGPKRTYQHKASRDGLELRVAEGLLETLFLLAQTYSIQGSAREAEYFAQQAHDLAESLHAPSMVGHALARSCEILLRLGRLEEGHDSLLRASDLIGTGSGPQEAEIRRLRGYYNQLGSNHDHAQQHYREATAILDDLTQALAALEGTGAGPRMSLGFSPRSPRTQLGGDALLPALFAKVLREYVCLLQEAGEDYHIWVERFATLPTNVEAKAQEVALIARLTLRDVYARFKGDMFLSSLTDSTLTIPIGMSGAKATPLSPAAQDALGALLAAEKLFWSDFTATSSRGSVIDARDAAILLTSVKALQTSLGKSSTETSAFVARLLDLATSLTLRRELLETLQHKFPDWQNLDDLRWPSVNGSSTVVPLTRKLAKLNLRFDSDEEADASDEESDMKDFWTTIRKKYQSQSLDLAVLTAPRSTSLPAHWTVVNISITEDKNTMFISRQRHNSQPLVFCLPLKGRRENVEDEQHLTFDDALEELKEIIRLSDEGTRQAANVHKDDRKARAAWWTDRRALDQRMRELLENIEFCWLGAFKTILGPPRAIPTADLTTLRSRISDIFERNLHTKDRKQKARVKLDDALLDCISALNVSCRDEELEDLVYFILDLYQFHGVPIATAEVDIDHVVVDMRTALEEHTARLKASPGANKQNPDEHVFLVLDKNVQGIPWESIPIMRGRSVSRIPSLDFLEDRIELARRQRQESAAESPIDRISVDPRKTWYLLNPSGDLKGTEGRFSTWLREMHPVGWDGVVGRAPSEQQLVNALSRNELVIYFGHGGAEQYVRSHKIRHLPRCAATMLWGCSSGALKEMGDYDRVGTPYNYMLAGCPTLVANLWDVTDRDIDTFSQSVFDDLHLTPAGVQAWKDGEADKTSVVAAVAKARETCKLKYLTGAAPVVYGIPFYL
ncbi:hypothetical protein CERSUDRAFT_92811 [Gelatoporia subvermispora B]|uniref:separase n=1 Tax=Ceriporiopsis subvermispora (strain B) TaxID=914234 RepID=M2R2K9_CERS8|nr:hypothetical protein CERSUDRAFT_92811 [Gelatoporia subvermispora B]